MQPESLLTCWVSLTLLSAYDYWPACAYFAWYHKNVSEAISLLHEQIIGCDKAGEREILLKRIQVLCLQV